MFLKLSNSSEIIDITIDRTIISPASATQVAISSRSLFLSIWQITASKIPIPAILKIISTLILHQ